MLSRKGIVIVCLLMLGWSVSFAGASGEGVVETEVRRVALFKNGYGFLTRAGEIPAGTETLLVSPVPRAALGTLWFSTTEDGPRILGAESVLREVEIVRPAMNFRELILGNPGKAAKVFADREIYGTILRVPEPFEYPDGLFPDPVEPMNYGYGYPNQRNMSILPPNSRPEFFRVREQEWLGSGPAEFITTIPFSSVQGLRFSDEPKTTFVEKQKRRLFECRLEENDRAGEVGMHYLQAGICWIPGYEIDLAGDSKAVVRLKATVINDLEDLEAVEVHLIVGFPNFLYSDLEEPISGRQSLQSFLQSLGGGQTDQRRRRESMMTQQMELAMGADFSAPAVPALPKGGEFREDLFFYPPIKASLKKGERASFVISEDSAPYEHVYTWDIPDTIPINPQGYEQRGGQDERKDTVWHKLKLENDGERPWTTGSALIVQEGFPLGQDMLNYTSIGGETLVKITQATDVIADKKEFELERSQNTENIYGDRFIPVTIKGEMSIENRRSEAINVMISKITTGTVSETDPEAEVTVRAEGLRPVNQQSHLKWELSLERGEKKQLTYVTKVYVRP